MPLSVQLEQRLEKLNKDDFLGPTGFRTAALFRDHPTKTHNDQYAVFLISKEKSTKDYISLKEVYMAIADVTEYEFAMRVFGSYRHWKHLSELSWVKEYVSEWRHELATMLKSKAIKGVVELVDDEYVKETTKLQGLKWLAGGEFAEKTTESAKKKKEKQERINKDVLSDISEDFNRLNIQPRSIN